MRSIWSLTYASAVLFVNCGVGPVTSVFIAVAVAVAAAFLLGWLGFRFRIEGVYFSLLTIAFAEIARIGFDNWSFVGGAAGFFLPVNAALSDQWWSPARQPPLFFYYLALAMAAASLLIAAVLRSSKLGYAFLAIRETRRPPARSASALNRTRFLALFISAAMTAVGGDLHRILDQQSLPRADPRDLQVDRDHPRADHRRSRHADAGPFVGAFLLVPLGSRSPTACTPSASARPASRRWSTASS